MHGSPGRTDLAQPMLGFAVHPGPGQEQQLLLPPAEVLLGRVAAGCGLSYTPKTRVGGAGVDEWSCHEKVPPTRPEQEGEELAAGMDLALGPRLVLTTLLPERTDPTAVLHPLPIGEIHTWT